MVIAGGRDDSGITLTEVLVIVVLVLVLVAIAIPTFLAGRQRHHPPSGLVFSKRHELPERGCAVVMKVVVCTNGEDHWYVTLQRCDGSGPPSQRCKYREVEVEEDLWRRAVTGVSVMENGRL